MLSVSSEPAASSFCKSDCSNSLLQPQVSGDLRGCYLLERPVSDRLADLFRHSPSLHRIRHLSLKLKPAFIEALDHATAFHETQAGTIAVSWKREGKEIILDVKIPKDIIATIEIGPNFCFENRACSKTIASGTYKIVQITKDI